MFRLAVVRFFAALSPVASVALASLGLLVGLSAPAAPESVAIVAPSPVEGSCDATAAINIELANPEEAILAEYVWLAQHYPGWEKESQALLSMDGRFYDAFVLRRGSENSTVCFDITEYWTATYGLRPLGLAKYSSELEAYGAAGFLPLSPDHIRASDLFRRKLFGTDRPSGLIGRISDLVLLKDGRIRAALVEIDGEPVAVPIPQIHRSGKTLRVAMSRTDLKQRPKYEGGTDDRAAPSGLKKATQELKVTDLLFGTVYGPDEQRLGKVDDVVFAPNGEIEAVLVTAGKRAVPVRFTDVFVLNAGAELALIINADEERLTQATSYPQEYGHSMP